MDRPTREEILSEAAEGTLLRSIFERYGTRASTENEATAKELAELHNSGEIDVLSIVSAADLKRFPKHVFFTGHAFYGLLIPKLDTSADRIARAIDELVNAAGMDGMRYQPLEGFAMWCGSKPERAEELLSLAVRGGGNSNHYLNIAIRCGFQTNKGRFLAVAYDTLQVGSDADVRSVLAALDHLPLLLPSDREWFLKGISALFAREPSDGAKSSALTSIVAQLKNAATLEYRERLIVLSLCAIAEGGDHVQHEVARLLFVEDDWLPDAIKEAGFHACAQVPSSNKGTFDLIDLVLQKAIERGDLKTAQSFVEHAIRRDLDPVPVKYFDSVFYHLRENGGQNFEDWIVTWLLDGGYELCSAIVEGFFSKGVAEYAFEVDLTRFKLRAEDYPYLARKAISTLFIQPLPMCSFVVCLIRSAPAAVVEQVGAFLFDPILLNYSGVVTEYLAPLVSTSEPTVSKLIQSAMDERDEYLKRLGAVGAIPELGPTERERQMEWQRHTDLMAEAYKVGRRNSLASVLFTEKAVLYGTGTVYRMYAGLSPQRMENELRKIEHSIEMPRLDIWDPVGLELMIRRFRLEERPE